MTIILPFLALCIIGLIVADTVDYLERRAKRNKS